jgi:hypothetical protein
MAQRPGPPSPRRDCTMMPRGGSGPLQREVKESPCWTSISRAGGSEWMNGWLDGWRVTGGGRGERFNKATKRSNGIRSSTVCSTAGRLTDIRRAMEPRWIGAAIGLADVAVLECLASELRKVGTYEAYPMPGGPWSSLIGPGSGEIEWTTPTSVTTHRLHCKSQ